MNNEFLQYGENYRIRPVEWYNIFTGKDDIAYHFEKKTMRNGWVPIRIEKINATNKLEKAKKVMEEFLKGK